MVLPSNQHFHPVQPVSRLEPFRVSETFPEAHLRIPPLPVVNERGENEHEAERILGYELRKGRKYYKVRFRGYGPEADEWLPIANLRNSMELVREYQCC